MTTLVDAGGAAEVLAHLLIHKNKAPRVAVLTGGFAGFFETFPFRTQRLQRDRKLSNELAGDSYPSLILPHLFLGNYRNAQNASALRHLGITHIVNCAKECENCAVGVHYINVPVYDHPDENIAGFFEETIQAIHSAIEQGGTVLVHCHMGQSRAATFLIAYVMWRENISLNAAIDFVKRRREDICPNPGFSLILFDFERTLREKRGPLDGSRPQL